VKWAWFLNRRFGESLHSNCTAGPSSCSQGTWVLGQAHLTLDELLPYKFTLPYKYMYHEFKVVAYKYTTAHIIFMICRRDLAEYSIRKSKICFVWQYKRQARATYGGVGGLAVVSVVGLPWSVSEVAWSSSITGQQPALSSPSGVNGRLCQDLPTPGTSQ
jgi:hypothetical protein